MKVPLVLSEDTRQLLDVLTRVVGTTFAVVDESDALLYHTRSGASLVLQCHLSLTPVAWTTTKSFEMGRVQGELWDLGGPLRAGIKPQPLDSRPPSSVKGVQCFGT